PLFHATPPPTLTARAPTCPIARSDLPTRVPTTAAWNEAATSATSAASQGGPAREASAVPTAVLSPEKEKSNPGRSSIGRGKSNASARPCAASWSIGGPPGKPSPSRLATLSYASPAASSSVAPSQRY